ncbi:hypothetical protein H0H81_012434 [Sphagnurus paluster]|uniref:CsbD-like domain-containing protein n=1 Tax=Sphagnurus paluster TaxID=117069 RepID=A0A9P7FPU7_9AGAR|nr:hypothetical protein H0H81_012434 [Sphagnurus paluster]
MSSDNSNSNNTSSANNLANGEPAKISGQYHSVKGTVVGALGNLTGATTWQEYGKQEHAEGEAEYKAAQLKGYAEGTIDRFAGKKDAIVGAITGDRTLQVEGNAKEDKGQVQQEANS